MFSRVQKHRGVSWEEDPSEQHGGAAGSRTAAHAHLYYKHLKSSPVFI